MPAAQPSLRPVSVCSWSARKALAQRAVGFTGLAATFRACTARQAERHQAAVGCNLPAKCWTALEARVQVTIMIVLVPNAHQPHNVLQEMSFTHTRTCLRQYHVMSV